MARTTDFLEVSLQTFSTEGFKSFEKCIQLSYASESVSANEFEKIITKSAIPCIKCQEWEIF